MLHGQAGKQEGAGWKHGRWAWIRGFLSAASVVLKDTGDQGFTRPSSHPIKGGLYLLSNSLGADCKPVLLSCLQTDADAQLPLFDAHPSCTRPVRQLGPSGGETALRELLPAAAGDRRDQSDLASLRTEAQGAESEDKHRFSSRR